MLWYEGQRAGLGSEFLGAIHAVLRRVGAAPEQFAPWSDSPRFRRALAGRFPYAIFFHIVGDEPVVVAVAHTSRRPGYWLDRAERSEDGR
jgi:plasmid stabilization system protein ParE